MQEFLSLRLGELIGRIDGPMHFRLIIQPLVAIIFAVRAGLRDAREGRPPFFWALAYDRGHRRDLLSGGWHDVGKVFIAAVILDAIYQLAVLHAFYPVEAVIVALVLALVPYVLVRAPVTRLAGGTGKRL